MSSGGDGDDKTLLGRGVGSFFRKVAGAEIDDKRQDAVTPHIFFKKKSPSKMILFKKFFLENTPRKIWIAPDTFLKGYINLNYFFLCKNIFIFPAFFLLFSFWGPF